MTLFLVVKRTTDSQWSDVALDTQKIPPLDTPSKAVGDHVHDTFKILVRLRHMRLVAFLTVLDKVGEEKEVLRVSNFQLSILIK